jgi:hypothetical protein
LSDAAPSFPFVQVEIPWALGPPDGRYVLRDDRDAPPGAVLVLRTLGAPERRRLGRRRASKAVAPEPAPAPVLTTRATVVSVAQRFESPEAAERWLHDAGEETVSGALTQLNGALAAHRLASADPHVREVARDAAIVARVGFGAGEQVAEGRWTQAREVPPPRERRQRRTTALRPQERFAALVGAREMPLACEELALRARLDLDAGRLRPGALQLRAALEAAVIELGRDGRGEGMTARLTELGALRERAERAAGRALAGEEPDRDDVALPLGRLEAALRARGVAGT